MQQNLHTIKPVQVYGFISATSCSSLHEVIPLSFTRASIIVCIVIHQLKSKNSWRILTKTVLLITRTTPLHPYVILQWAMAPVIMLVSYLFKKMKLVFPGEYPCSNAMDRCISPTLCRKSKGERWDRVESTVPSNEREPHNRTRPWSRGTRRMQYTQGLARNPYLRSQSCSRLRTHILTCEWQRVNYTTYNGICCMSRHHHVRRIPWHCPKRQIPGASWRNLEYLFIITARRVNYCIPLTCPHKVGMVAVISYTAMVNANGGHYGWFPSKRSIYELTIYFIVVLHEQERVVIDVTMKLDIGSSRSNQVIRKHKIESRHFECAYSTRQYHLYFWRSSCLKKNW